MKIELILKTNQRVGKSLRRFSSFFLRYIPTCHTVVYAWRRQEYLNGGQNFFREGNVFVGDSLQRLTL